MGPSLAANLTSMKSPGFEPSLQTAVKVIYTTISFLNQAQFTKKILFFDVDIMSLC